MALTTRWAHEFSQHQLPASLPLRHGDGYETVVYAWSPPPGAERKLPVVQLHGIQSHPGWFGLSAQAMAAAGHAVYQVTRRGSGENEKQRGHAPSARRLLLDVQDACDFVLAREHSHLLHIVGICWGGKLAACHCAAGPRRADIATLTLVVPGIAVRVDVPPLTKIGVAWSILGNRLREFEIPLADAALFTDNPRKQEYLCCDPLRLHRATAGFLFASRQLDRRLRGAGKGCLEMPVKLVLANRDRIVDNERTRGIVRRLCGAGLQVIDLEGAHILEFEQDPSTLLRAVAAEDATL